MYEEKKPGEKRRGGRRRREKEREDKNVKMGKTRKRRGAERERESKREGGIKHHGMTSATKPTTFSELKLSHSFFALSCPRGRSGWTISRG